MRRAFPVPRPPVAANVRDVSPLPGFARLIFEIHTDCAAGIDRGAVDWSLAYWEAKRTAGARESLNKSGFVSGWALRLKPG